MKDMESIAYKIWLPFHIFHKEKVNKEDVRYTLISIYSVSVIQVFI